MSVIKSFLPIVNSRSRILILGTMPGVKSLQAREYYAHPQNQFWKVMAALLGYERPLTYKQKKEMLLRHRIALWDVIASCRREGSADAHIRNMTFNDFAGLFRRYPNIRAVFCNGNASFQYFRKISDRPYLSVEKLPSTSPAHTKSLAQKMKGWKKILSRIDGE